MVDNSFHFNKARFNYDSSKLASHLGVSLAEVVAIGGGVNDIPLLSDVGLAVVMQNASDELKAIADFITLDVDHSAA